MIEFAFTIDYEIHGNGAGSLGDLVYEPTRRLETLFEANGMRFVGFIEVAELEKIETQGTDSAIDAVKQQIRELRKKDFEIALHLHPQWANARYAQGRWTLDFSEYNLCTLPAHRIAEIVDRSLAYLRHVVDDSRFTPLSFRAGNWLFQPTQTAAGILAERGIRIDSSVFKGGLQHNHDLDYRPALRNGFYWPFRQDVNRPDPAGPWIEVPIHAEMVRPWKMSTPKRMSFSNQFGGAGRDTKHKVLRALDFMRLRYPLKLDFCRMTFDELTSMMGKIIQDDLRNPETYRPVVAIGHTKDLTDLQTIESFVSFLAANRIKVSTLSEMYPTLSRSASWN